MSGKGDARRPAQVSRETYAENYRRAFGDGARAVPAPLAEIAETGPRDAVPLADDMRQRVRDLLDPAYTPPDPKAVRP